MGNLFGKKKESRVTEQDKAVLQLKQQRDQLKIYQKKIGIQLEKDRTTAKQALHNGNKEKAKLMLRKKKFQESLLEKTEKQLENIETMVHDLEFAQIEVQVVQGLKSGTAALKKMNQILSIENVEKIMEESQEAIEYQKEIDAILAGGLTAEDEDDVLKELEQIIQESLPEAPVGDNIAVPELPEVPTHKIAEDAPRQKVPKKEREAVAAT
jgi:charged multivesicular body protein 6